jgi:putative ABC transport system permease protein
MSTESSSSRPPWLAAWLFRKLFPDHGMDSASGDLEEIFRALAENEGRRKARGWFWRQLLRAFPQRVLAVIFLDIPMFLGTLKIMSRSLAKNKLFTALTLFALTLGLTCFFLIFLYVRYESTYDAFHPDADRIFRLNLEDAPGAARDKVAGPAAHALEAHVPEIEASVQTCLGFNPVVKAGKEKFETAALFVGPDFFRMFNFPIRRGREQTLAEPGQVVLTERIARLLFGRQDPLGRPLDVSIRGENCRLTVAGVMADPRPDTHFDFELLISDPTTRILPGYRRLLDSWKNRFPRTYVKLRRNSSIRNAEEKMAAFLNRTAAGASSGAGLRAILQPITDIHLRPDGKNAAAIRSLRLFFLLSVLVLVVAVVNSISLSTSRSSLRRLEIGVRKTIGARRGQLIRQFLGESLVLTTGAFLLAVTSLLALLPALNKTLERNLRLDRLFSGASGLEIAAIVLLVGIAAGFAPALRLSSFPAARILKGGEAPHSTRSFSRNVLLVVQFAAAVVLVVGTLFIREQMRFLKNGNPGFDKSGIVETWAFPPNGRAAKNRLLENPKVTGATLLSNQLALSNRTPLDEKWGQIEVLRGSAWEPLNGGVFRLGCDQDFIPIFKLRLKTGRNFSAALDERSSAIINETLAGRLGPGNALGKTIRIRGEGTEEARPLNVVGIIGDFHFQPLFAPIGPALLTSARQEEYAVLYVRFDQIPGAEALAAVKAAVDEFFPEESHPPVFLEDRLDSLYKGESQQAALMVFFSTLAVLIAGLGVFGLAGFAVERRTRELAIRKVLGARTGRMFLRLSVDFAALLAVAYAIAAPLAFIFVNRWMSNFAYHVRIGAATFLAAAAGLLALMVLMSGTQISRISRINPVEILKEE